MIRILTISFFFLAGISASGIPADTVKIGLLIPDNRSLAAKNAAELAVKEANRSAGNKIVFKLETRSMEGPWGIGARQAVDLVFNKKVCALIACVDGRNAHLAEQVAAKHQILFINAGSGDPTLSRAFIPWYFSCINDYRQNAVFLSSYFNKKDIRKVTVICDTTYDSGIAAAELIKAFKPSGTETSLIRLRKSSDFKPEEISTEAKQSVIVVTERRTSSEIVNKLYDKVHDIHYFNL
ncbi:MAG TPA: ABC transporter substrate-binding protein, partial [Bacteroidales bacterium]|nr:ABC transporter substrate-binding protein [Bacteroidales bacterium]